MNSSNFALNLLVIMALSAGTCSQAQELPGKGRQEHSSQKRRVVAPEDGIGDVVFDDRLQPVAGVNDPIADAASSPPPYYGLGGNLRPFGNTACPSVYAQVEALYFMQQPRFSRQAIVVDPNANATLLSTSDLDFGHTPGLQAMLGMRLRENWAAEGSYIGIFDGHASASAVKPDPAAFLTFPNNLVGNAFVDMDRTQVDYRSRFNSFEWNLVYCLGGGGTGGVSPGCGGCGTCADCAAASQSGGGHGGGAGYGGSSPFGRSQSFAWFGGFRYINVGEQLNITSQRTVAGLFEQGTYNIRTTNRLYGGQIGARWRQTWGRFGWEATGKSGLFGNDGQQQQFVNDFPNFALRPGVSTRGGSVSYLGEANVSGIYRVTPVWSIRTGYTALWLGGLALAPNQLDYNFAAAQGGTQLRNNSGMFLHGMNAGLEARW